MVCTERNAFHVFYEEYCVLLIDEKRSNKKKQIINKLFAICLYHFTALFLPFRQKKQDRKTCLFKKIMIKIIVLIIIVILLRPLYKYPA